MADKIKKTADEVKEKIADTREGAVTDETVETAAGGLTVKLPDINPFKTGEEKNR